MKRIIGTFKVIGWCISCLNYVFINIIGLLLAGGSMQFVKIFSLKRKWSKRQTRALIVLHVSHLWSVRLVSDGVGHFQYLECSDNPLLNLEIKTRLQF